MAKRNKENIGIEKRLDLLTKIFQFSHNANNRPSTLGFIGVFGQILYMLLLIIPLYGILFVQLGTTETFWEFLSNLSLVLSILFRMLIVLVCIDVGLTIYFTIKHRRKQKEIRKDIDNLISDLKGGKY